MATVIFLTLLFCFNAKTGGEKGCGTSVPQNPKSSGRLPSVFLTLLILVHSVKLTSDNLRRGPDFHCAGRTIGGGPRRQWLPPISCQIFTTLF